MQAYNVKVIQYLYGTQVRVYSDLVNKRACYEDDFCVADFDKVNNYKSENLDNENNNRCDADLDIDNDNVDDDINDDNGVKSARSLASSKNRTINCIYDIARSNDWDYFLTLTFDPKKIDSFDYELVSKKLSQWIDNFKRKNAPDLKYILVPELHKSGRYHFHGLLKDIGNMKLINSGHKDSSGNVIYNLGNYKLGFSTVTKINDVRRCSSYISKYITKDLCFNTFGKKRYWASRNLDEPVVTNLVLSPQEIEDMILTFNREIVFQKTIECTGYYNLKVSYYELEN